MELEPPEIDPNFEPQTRARSNTWPLRPKEFVKEEQESRTPNAEEGSQEAVSKDVLGLKQKTSSRRNAWGNMSYADLITKAIQGSPEQRLTLSQIYDWMVQNVPYFKDKGDSNSSAGWKNSIRHNLSLHNRFMRIQNEGAGKSSWWVINPDAKPGKSPRRRATSMDTKAYEKKRGRAKKKVEAYRASLEGAAGSPLHGSTDELSDAFQLSPQDFRARTSSNASSVGRLSPIQSALEPDLHDNQVPPMSPIPWNQAPGGLGGSPYTPKSDGFTPETQSLTESLAGMFVEDKSIFHSDNMRTLETLLQDQPLSNSSLSTPSPLQSQLSPASSNLSFQESSVGLMPAPPPYNDQMRQSPQQQSPQQPQQQTSPQPMMASSMSPNMPGSLSPNMANSHHVTTLPMSLGSNGISLDSSSSLGNSGPFLTQSMGELLQMDVSSNGGMFQQEPPIMHQDPMMSAGPARSQPSINQFNLSSNSAFQSPSPNNIGGNDVRALAPQQPGIFGQRQLTQQHILGMNNSLLRQALTQKAGQMALRGGQVGQTGQALLNQLQQQQQQHQAQQQLAGMYGLPTDLDSIADINNSEFECDVDQIINHEMSFEDGCLDFNFDQQQVTAQSQQKSGSADGQFGTIQT